MFWDKVASLYDFFETVYNGKCYKNLPLRVADHIVGSDKVLECACGTGIITAAIARRCDEIIATDFSEGMLKQAHKRCDKMQNVSIRKADIMQLPFEADTFDKVVAGNVIHLLDHPAEAMAELVRVCRKGGQIIVPTYINITVNGKASLASRLLEMLGVSFKREFDQESYKTFFANMGYRQVEYSVVEGRMPCAIAVITVEK